MYVYATARLYDYGRLWIEGGGIIVMWFMIMKICCDNFNIFLNTNIHIYILFESVSDAYERITNLYWIRHKFILINIFKIIT